MKIVYQGETVETEATDVASFLAHRLGDSSSVLVEYRGDVYGAGADLAALALEEGSELNVFKIVAGG